jgi:uncharacterized protein YdeI (YjbR/CyaY-like superfamily)
MAARAPREETAPDGRRMVHAETRAQWRAWLGAHHGETVGVWLVSWKKATGRPAIPYAEAVEEGLCVGWVDSKPGRLDDERTLLWFAPRKAGSGWSRPNKERVERLTAEGLMLPAGTAVVEAARRDGSWSKLDEVEDLLEPDDLRAALDADPEARAAWDAFPRSAKRGILEWIVQAKKPETRAVRVATTVSEAHEGRRANQWRPRR